MLGAYEPTTIWNKWRDPSTKKDKWFRHIVLGCSWQNQVARTVSGQTASTATTARVLIADNPAYLSPATWDSAGEAAKRCSFTLRPGDIVARGEHDLDITGEGDNTAAKVLETLKPDAFKISAVSDNTQAYRRGGHYHVEG